MDACVRNGLWGGALDIAAFSNVLERRHLKKKAPGSSAVVISGIIEECRATMVTRTHYSSPREPSGANISLGLRL